ncbi:DUF2255 family protein [Limosilactobacillus sp.]|uniref:DUF2255 family protein n=1 Tax=Limosilactobacillus sp. TaxID=2773925 RepID=UPI00345EDCA6
MAWTNSEIDQFNLAQAIQNRPLDNDCSTFLEDSPTWVVAVADKIFIRAAQGKGAKWYQKGIKNGGVIELHSHNYPVKYIPVTNSETIEQVSKQYLHKYHWQLPVELMVSNKAADATLELVKSESTRR